MTDYRRASDRLREADRIIYIDTRPEEVARKMQDYQFHFNVPVVVAIIGCGLFWGAILWVAHFLSRSR